MKSATYVHVRPGFDLGGRFQHARNRCSGVRAHFYSACGRIRAALRIIASILQRFYSGLVEETRLLHIRRGGSARDYVLVGAISAHTQSTCTGYLRVPSKRSRVDEAAAAISKQTTRFRKNQAAEAKTQPALRMSVLPPAPTSPALTVLGESCRLCAATRIKSAAHWPRTKSFLGRK